MKNKILFLAGAAATAIILAFNISISSSNDGSDINLNLLIKTASAQSESGEGGSSGGGCYISSLIECANFLGIGFGQEKICEFQNVYGYPYSCTEIPCVDFGGRTVRTCVQGS